MKENNLAKNTFLLSIGTILNKCLTFIMIPLFSRWISTEDYGTFDLVCTYVTLLLPIISLSAGEGIFRLGIEVDKDKQKKYITSGTIIYFFGIIFLGIILIMIKAFFKFDLIIPFYILLIGEILNKLLQSFLRTIKKLNIYSFVSIISTICIFIFVTVFVKILNMKLYGIIYGYAIGFLIGDILIAFLGKFFKYLTLKWSFKEICEIIKYSVPLIPNSISWWIVNVSDRIIISIFLGTVANGIYAIAYKIPNLCTSIFNVFGIAWQETAIDVKDEKNNNIYFNKIYNTIILKTMSICAGILALNFVLFKFVFDIRYINAHLYVPILVSSVIFSVVSQFFGGIQVSFKETKKNGISTVCGAIINLIVHIMLVKYIGLYAAAISTLMSTILISFIRRVTLKNKIKVFLQKSNYKFVIIYLYLLTCSYFCMKLSVFVNVVNLLIAIIMFININKDLINKIFKKLGGKMKKKSIIKIMLSIPKTLYFNFKSFKFSTAIHLPIIISYKVKLGEVHKNVIKLENWKNKRYKIVFGFGGSSHIISNRYSYLSFGKDASITFNGKANFAEGCSFRCDYGKITFGKNFSGNRNCCINCEYEMEFGDDILLGWNVNIRDTDGHAIFENEIKKESQKKVIIGNHVWICSYSDLLKGCKIGNDSVVAWRSCVLKEFDANNLLIGGFPAKIIKENINWEK